MIISDFFIYQYSLPFIHPIKMMNQTMTSRDGLLVRLETDDGLFAFGDVPPFPGLSEESIELVFIQLENICRTLKGCENPVRTLNSDRLSALFPGLYPSVSFGIESALIDLAAQTAHKSITELFSTEFHNYIKTNGLVSGKLHKMPDSAKALVDHGYSHLKIKVGRSDIDSEIQLLQKLSDVVGFETKLRLDANRSWKFEDAVHFAQRVSELNIDYIEEPLVDSNQLETFYEKTQMPIALDESLLHFEETPPVGTTAVIIKPGIHGGVFESIKWIKKAQAQNIRPVISSAFLSAVGLSVTTCLAAAFTQQDDVMGLDTSAWFAQDFLNKPLSIQNGQINISKLNQNISISPQTLTQLC